MHSDARIIRLVLTTSASRLDLGNYRHTRLQVVTGSGDLYLNTESQLATATAGFFLPAGTAETGPSNVVNLDGLNGVLWVASGSGAGILAVIQWGCN